jgi:hypothetical protein
MNRRKTMKDTPRCPNHIRAFSKPGPKPDAAPIAISVITRKSGRADGEVFHLATPIQFNQKTKKHLKEVVIPIGDRILGALKLPYQKFDISFLGVNGASDSMAKYPNPSLDIPVLLSVLSTGLGIAIERDIVSSNLTLTIEGEISTEGGIPESINAALKDSSVRSIILPKLNNPLNHLSEKEKQKTASAVNEARSALKILEVGDVSELVKSVFLEEQIVLASLRNGFFKAAMSFSRQETLAETAAKFLGKNNEMRFWRVLERWLMGGKNTESRELLMSLSRFHIEQKSYPKGLGHKLLLLLQSLPPETRRFKIDFPVLPILECIKLSQHAKDSDYEDVKILLNASFGEKAKKLSCLDDGYRSKNRGNTIDGERMLQTVLSEINAEALASLIGQPIDSARASYVMDSVTVNSHDDFNHTVTSFYVHLMRHAQKATDSIDSNTAGAEAFTLLEKAFSGKGGFQAALNEARNPTRGGLRFVIDLITDQFKREEQEKHINRVLKTAIDPLDWEGKVELMRTLLERLAPNLPVDIASQPPEMFTGNYETVVRAYVESFDQMKSLLRSL